MYCSFCGTELKDDAKFCHNCGKAVGQAPAQETSEQPQQEKEASGQSKKGYFENLAEAMKASGEERKREENARKKDGRGLVIAVVIIVIIGALVALFS